MTANIFALFRLRVDVEDGLMVEVPMAPTFNLNSTDLLGPQLRENILADGHGWLS